LSRLHFTSRGALADAAPYLRYGGPALLVSATGDPFRIVMRFVLGGDSPTDT